MSPRGITMIAGAALLACSAAMLWYFLENEPPPAKPAVSVAPVAHGEPAKAESIADGPASAAAPITSFQPRQVEAPNTSASPPPPPADDPLSPAHLQRLRSMAERNIPAGLQVRKQLQEFEKANPSIRSSMHLEPHFTLRGYARQFADPIDGPVMLETLRADPKFFRTMRAHLATLADRLQLQTDVVTARTPEELVSLITQAVQEAQPAFEQGKAQNQAPPPMVSLAESWHYFGAVGEFAQMFIDSHGLGFSPEKGFFPKPPPSGVNFLVAPVNR